MKKITAWMFTIVFLGTALMFAAKTVFAAGDPLAVAPEMYKLKFENDRVRVMEVTFAPGAKIAEHSHPDHVAVITGAGKLTITNADGTTQELDGKVGDAMFIPSVTHYAVNSGTTEVKVTVIELKERAAVPENADSAAVK
jgi:beta-alanine degradation protein BauB